MLKLAEELKTNKISRYHLIYGDERYMVRYYKHSLMEKLSSPGDEMNCTIFQGNSVRESEIADVGQILPFMVSQRLIVVQDSGFFKSANDMADYLEDFPETTYVVFVEREVDKRNRLYKWIGKNGCVTECQTQSEAMLKQWIAGYLKKAGKSVSVRTVEYLIERTGTDMESLNNELDKLIGFTGERPVVEVSDIDAVCSGAVISKIFDMIDAVALGEKNRALRLYDDLLANKEQPISAVGVNKNELAKRIGIPPFTVPKYGKQAGLFKRRQLIQMLEDRANYEESFKKGRLSDQLAVEMV